MTLNVTDRIKERHEEFGTMYDNLFGGEEEEEEEVKE